MGAFQPSADETHDLGTTLSRWKDVHADKLVVTGALNDGKPLTSTIGGTLSVNTLTITGQSSSIALNDNRITGLASPEDNNDAVTKLYADQAEADAITTANSYTDTRESVITSAYQSYADQAEADAITTSNAYTDTRETAITTAYQTYTDQAEADAKSYADGIVASEATARANADTTLQANIDTEKERIDAILTASTADKDTFAEIVTFINQVDTENDTALGTEITIRANADTTLQANIDAEAAARANADDALASDLTAKIGDATVDGTSGNTITDRIATSLSSAEAYTDQAETDAKAYTDTRETAITTAYQAYTDQAETDAKAYTDTRETAITTAYQSYADQAETDAITTSNAYTDTRETAITTAYQTYADQTEVDAKAYTDARETAITTAYQTYADQSEADAITSANAYTDAREAAITTAYQTYADQAETDAETAALNDLTNKIGDATVDGTAGNTIADRINTAEAVAISTSNAYTDTRETAITSAYQAYTDQAETDAKAYTDTREIAITTAYQTYADQAEVDAISTSNTYTDTRETAITTAYQTYADQAEADAKAYTDTREAAITTAYQTYADQAETDAKAYTDTRETAITTAYQSYADSLVQGISAKTSVVAATIEPGDLSIKFENGDEIDGVILSTGDRILIKDQTNASENGIYVVNASGAPSRADDMAADSNAAGVFVFVEEGTVNGDNGFLCTTNEASAEVGTDNLTFVQFSGAGQITAGTGLSKSGNTLNVNISETDNTSNSYLIFADSYTGDNDLEAHQSLYYNPSTDTIHAGSFSGNSATATTATMAETLEISADYDTNGNQYILFSDAGDGTNGKIVRYDDNLNYNPGTNMFSAGSFYQTSSTASSFASGTFIGNLKLSDGLITSSSGAISFNDENLSTTGTLDAGVATLASGSIIGNMTYSNNTITGADANDINFITKDSVVIKLDSDDNNIDSSLFIKNSSDLITAYIREDGRAGFNSVTAGGAASSFVSGTSIGNLSYTDLGISSDTSIAFFVNADNNPVDNKSYVYFQKNGSSFGGASTNFVEISSEGTLKVAENSELYCNNLLPYDLTSITIDADFLPKTTGSYDIGSATLKFRDIHMSGNINANYLSSLGVKDINDNTVMSFSNDGKINNLVTFSDSASLRLDDNSISIEGASEHKLYLQTNSSTGSVSPTIRFRKNDTGGSLVSGDKLGEIWFEGAENSSVFYYGAAIEAQCDGNWVGITNRPSKLVFKTMLTSTANEVLVLDSNQNATFSGDVTLTDGILYVKGSDAAKINIHHTSTSATSGPELEMTTYKTSIVAGDNLGEIWFKGSEDNSTFYSAAAIIGEADGDWNPGTSNHGRLTFYTTSGTSSYNEVLRLSSDKSATFSSDVNLTGKILVKQDAETAANSGIHLVESDDDNDIWAIYRSETFLNFTRSIDGGSNYTAIGYLNPSVAAGEIDFTGQHRSIPSEINGITNNDIGKIVVSTGAYRNLNTENVDKPNIDESLPTIMLSNSRNDKKVYGVVSSLEDPNESSRQYSLGIFGSTMEKNGSDDNRVIVNAIGEGAIWVCNINGNLENGDYITTCEVPGLGMKQDDDLLHNYTVAKITQDCDFDLNATNYDVVEFEHEGQIYRKAFVGCTYHCG